MTASTHLSMRLTDLAGLLSSSDPPCTSFVSPSITLGCCACLSCAKQNQGGLHLAILCSTLTLVAVCQTHHNVNKAYRSATACSCQGVQSQLHAACLLPVSWCLQMVGAMWLEVARDACFVGFMQPISGAASELNSLPLRWTCVSVRVVENCLDLRRLSSQSQVD